MNRHNEQILADVIREIIRENGWDDKLLETRIQSSFHDWFGPLIAKNTSRISLKEGVLELKVEAASLRHEMMYSREKMKDIINSSFKKEVIKSIDIR
jgi:hypothetical protein